MRNLRYNIYWLATKLRGQPVTRILQELTESQYWARTDFESYQSHLLDRLLKHAIEHVPYYNKVIDVNRLKLAKSAKEKLACIPFLTKELISSESCSLKAKSYAGRSLIKTTGGTTGPPVRVLKDHSSMAYELAAAWRGYAWAGVEVADRQARFWSLPTSMHARLEAQLTDFVCNRKRYPTSGYNEVTFVKYCKSLLRQKPDYIYGYASMLREFSQYLLDSNWKPRGLIKAVISTAEVLSTEDRSIISAGFGCRVYDEYGCGEVNTIAHECRMGHMHINAENMIVEIVDRNGFEVHNGVGEVVITDLRNMAMPLIRYRTGDLASIGIDRCDCGISLPILSGIVGRAYDVLVSPDGRRFHGSLISRLFSELEERNLHVDGYQLVQQEDHSILVRLVVGLSKRSMIENHIRQVLDEKLGVCRVCFEYVSMIPRESSGKVRRVKSLIGKQGGRCE